MLQLALFSIRIYKQILLIVTNTQLQTNISNTNSFAKSHSNNNGLYIDIISNLYRMDIES